MQSSCTEGAPSHPVGELKVVTQQGCHLARGAQLAELGEFHEAAIAFSAHVQASPEDAVALEMYAQVLQELGAYDDARTAASKAVQLRPDWVEAHATFARCSLNCGALKEALQGFNTAKLLRPTDPLLAQEAEEVAQLFSQQVSQRVGLPLTILSAQAPGIASSHGGPGSVLWDCGILLAWYLNNCLGSSALRDVPMLELGSGLGIAGIAAAQCGARVTLTDTREVLPALAANVAANAEAIQEARGSAKVALCDWDAVAKGDMPRGFDMPAGGWILGADLVYSNQQVAPLIGTIAAIAAACNPGVHVLLAHKHRSHTVDEALMAAAVAAGLEVTRLLPPQGNAWLEDPKFRCISLYILSCARCHGALMESNPEPSQESLLQTGVSEEEAESDKDAPLPAPPAPLAAANDLFSAQTPMFAHKSVAIIGFGLPGAGKSTVLKSLHGALANSVILDKDVVNVALLGTEHAMFSDYYDRHVRVQSYQVLFQLAASQFHPGKRVVVILDGQFGDKLCTNYIQDGLRSLPLHVTPMLVYFWCPSDVQFNRMRARGAVRDSNKYAQLEDLRASWLSEHESQIAAWNASCTHRGWNKVVRMSTEPSVQQQVHQLLQLIAQI